MDGLDASLLMAKAALGVKNKSIDMLREEVQGLRRENDDLFRAVLQGSATTAASSSSSSSILTSRMPGPSPAQDTPTMQPTPPAQLLPQAAQASSTAPETALTATAEAAAAAAAAGGPAALWQQLLLARQQQAAAAQEAAALKQQLQEQQQERVQEAAALRAELLHARQHIRALEAELQDTMDAAMQLWDTIQVGDFDGAGSSSRPGSLYQEQLSTLSGLYPGEGEEGEGDGTAWRTPSASPPLMDPSPLSADVTPRAAADTAAAAAAAAAGGHIPALRPTGLTPRGAIPAAAAAAAAAAGRGSSSAGASPRLQLSQQRSGPGSLVAGVDGGSGAAEGHAGLFTPIEARVQSLASKLRVYMMRQPGIALASAPSPLAGDSSSSGPALSPQRLQDPSTAAAAAAAAKAIAAAGVGCEAGAEARDVGSSDQH